MHSSGVITIFRYTYVALIYTQDFFRELARLLNPPPSLPFLTVRGELRLI